MGKHCHKGMVWTLIFCFVMGWKGAESRVADTSDKRMQFNLDQMGGVGIVVIVFEPVWCRRERERRAVGLHGVSDLWPVM